MASKIAANLLLSELLFCFGHSLMHTVPFLLKLHIFHHCSVRASFNTNLLFHPVDLAIEFAGPAAGLLGMHFCLWQDQAVLLYTYLIFQLWYAYDHDETMKLYHTKHHATCDSVYVIYSNLRGNPKNNLLKSYMKEQGLLPSPEQKSIKKVT